MSKKLTALGNRILSAFLDEQRAGACVPENGHACGVQYLGTQCWEGTAIAEYVQFAYNCTGACVQNQTNYVTAGFCSG